MAIKRFAGIVNGDVFSVLTIDSEYGTDQHPNLGEKMIVGWSSNPKVIAVPDNQEIGIGWTWDGEIFIKSTDD